MRKLVIYINKHLALGDRMLKCYSIYQLVDPRDGLPYYVGRTGRLTQRFLEHLIGDASDNLSKDAWIQELRVLGLRPLLQEVELVIGTTQDAQQRELYWIRSLRDEGMPLTNVSGMQPQKPPLEKMTAYLPRYILAKLDAAIEQVYQRTGKRVTRSEIVRRLIDQVSEEDVLSWSPRSA
jgi:hypothetical protein